MDDLTLPIFGNATLALQLMDLTGQHEDDDQVRDAVHERDTAREQLAKAKRAYTRVARVPDFPKDELAVFRARLERCEVHCDTTSARLRDAADERLRRARVRRRDVLNDALAKPPNVDPIVDRLDRADQLRRLEAMDADERALVLLTAAKEGTHHDLIRAALTSPSPPFATKSWAPLLPDALAEELREWVMARKAPETIGDIRAAWRLRRLAFDLDMERVGAPRPTQPPTVAEISVRPGRAT